MAKKKTLSSVSYEKGIKQRKRRNRKFMTKAQEAIAICAQLGIPGFKVDELFDLADEITEHLGLDSH
jgi:hypothetical protein